jgi:cbb3-type cytochrome oxidase maturation protein
MEALIYLVPLALSLGLLGLGAFLWSLKTGQYEDLDGAAWRAIIDDDAPGAALVDGTADEPIERDARAKSRSAEY